MKKSQKRIDRLPALSYIRANKKKVSFFCIGVIILFILIDISPFGGKNIQLYAKWAKCGHRPLIVDYGGMFGASPQVYVPAPSFISSGFEQGPPFFCTTKDAERAGYRGVY